MENIDKRMDIRLVTHWNNIGKKQGAERLIAKPNFKNSLIFTNNLVAIQMFMLVDFYCNYVEYNYGENAT